jgi:hypothetical protein
MADNTRMQTMIREAEKRLSVKIDSKFMDLATSLTHNMENMFRQLAQGNNSSGTGSNSRNYGYSCNTRLA